MPILKLEMGRKGKGKESFQSLPKMSAKSFGKYPGALIHAEIYYWQLSNNADNEQLPILQLANR